MKNQKYKVRGVEEMREIKDLEVSAFSNEGHGADDHDRQNDCQGNSGGVRKTTKQAKNTLK